MALVEGYDEAGVSVDRGLQDHFITRIGELRPPRKTGVTGVPAAASASRIASISPAVAPAAVMCSVRFKTASYSTISGTDRITSKCLFKAETSRRRDAPVSLRTAATSTVVSRTTRTRENIYRRQYRDKPRFFREAADNSATEPLTYFPAQ